MALIANVPPGRKRSRMMGTKSPAGAKSTARSRSSRGPPPIPPAHDGEGRGRAGAEPDQAERLTGGEVCPTQGSIADDAGAQERRHRLVGPPIGKVKDEIGVSRKIIGESAIPVKPGEARFPAQVLFPPPAEGAFAAGPS